MAGVDVREQLREIGERRERIQREQEALTKDTAKAVKRAKGKVPMSEVARLVKLERTYVYRAFG